MISYLRTSDPPPKKKTNKKHLPNNQHCMVICDLLISNPILILFEQSMHIQSRVITTKWSICNEFGALSSLKRSGS